MALTWVRGKMSVGRDHGLESKKQMGHAVKERKKLLYETLKIAQC